jgi:protein-disulfide isomerase
LLPPEEKLKHSFRKSSTLLIGLAAASFLLGAGPAAIAQVKSAEAPPSKSVGSKSAPITLVVFSDFECPACRALYEQTLRPLLDDYVASGKVYLQHRDFPLQVHKYSHEAARYANAAAHFGKYERVSGILYDNRESWAADGNIVKFVSQVLTPVEMKRVQAMVDSCREGSVAAKPASLRASPQSGTGCQLDKAIDEDLAAGQRIQVNQTPTLLIIHNGRTDKIAGVVSYQILKAYLDQLLAH